MKYTLIAEDVFSGTKITHEFEEEYLHEMISNLNLFLKGVGFVYDGELQIVNTNDVDVTSLDYDYGISEESPFSAIVDDHIDLTDAFPDMMSVDLDIPKTCGSAGCGKCGCGKNAN